MPDADCRESLVRCSEAELINEAYFLAVAQRMPGEIHRDKLALLAEVERLAAAAIHPLLIFYGLVPRDVSVLHTLGSATVVGSGGLLYAVPNVPRRVRLK